MAVLICTPTIDIRAAVVGYTYRIGEPITVYGGITQSMLREVAISGATVDVVTPNIRIFGGVLDSLAAPITTLAGTVEKLAVPISAVGGTVAIIGRQFDLSGANVLLLVPAAAIPAVFSAWVMNTKTTGMAEYTNYPFTSLFKVGKESFGIIDGVGLIRLTGTRDMGKQIHFEAQSGVSNMGSRNQKYFPDAYMRVRTEGVMEYALTVDETLQRVYTVDMREGKQGMHTKRVNGSKGLAKGIKGTVAQITVRNVDGADFDLQAIEQEVMETRRS